MNREIALPDRLTKRANLGLARRLSHLKFLATQREFFNGFSDSMVDAAAASR